MVGFRAGLLATAGIMGAVLLEAGGALHLLALLLSGLVAGLVVRLALPRSGPAEPAATLLVGVGGSMLGGFLGWFLFVGNRPVSLVCSAAAAASLVWLERRQTAAGVS